MTETLRKLDGRRFLQVAELVEHVYYETDSAGRIEDVCAAYGAVWRRDATSIVGGPWFHAVHAGDIDRVEQARERLLLDGQPFDEEYRILRGDGATRWIRDRAFHFPELERVVGVAHDITDNREVAAGRRHAEKLQTLGMLATSIAHDFGNLLQGVMGCLELALKDSTEHERARQYVKEANVALRGGAALTKQLTTFSRKDAPAAQPLALDVAVAHHMSMLKHLLGARVALQIDLRATGSLIWAQPVQIEQILFSLAANARDAMPMGGVFRIETRREMNGASSTDFRARLEVIDSGRGMDADTRTRIFDPFFTTKAIGQGTGLGLAVVRAVTTALHGRLHVESVSGLETRFVFSFPEVPAGERLTSTMTERAPTGTSAHDAPPSSSDPRGTTRPTGVFRRGNRG